MVRKHNSKKKRISPRTTAVIGALVIMIGGFFLSYNYVQTMKIKTYDFMANVIYVEKNGEGQIIKKDEEPETPQEVVEQPDEVAEQQETYLGYLKIPKIGLEKGFFSMESQENDVEKNILVVNGSTYPDVDKGNFIVAGHSGTGWKAFFNDLYKLNEGDEALVEYGGKTYKYNITKIYKLQKNGTIAIYRNYSKTTLTLVTCTNNDQTTQTIYIAELTSIE